MTQIVLYYPTISIPNTAWLRQAIFYFDKVASIAPQVLWDPNQNRSFVPLTPELDYLWHEGIYEPIDPDHLTGEVGRIMPENRNDEIGPQVAERQNWPTAQGILVARQRK